MPKSALALLFLQVLLLVATLLVVLLLDDLLSTLDAHSSDKVVLKVDLLNSSCTNPSDRVGILWRGFILGARLSFTPSCGIRIGCEGATPSCVERLCTAS